MPIYHLDMFDDDVATNLTNLGGGTAFDELTNMDYYVKFPVNFNDTNGIISGSEVKDLFTLSADGEEPVYTQSSMTTPHLTLLLKDLAYVDQANAAYSNLYTGKTTAKASLLAAINSAKTFGQHNSVDYDGTTFTADMLESVGSTDGRIPINSNFGFVVTRNLTITTPGAANVVEPITIGVVLQQSN
jgi:hypothetical protein